MTTNNITRLGKEPAVPHKYQIQEEGYLTAQIDQLVYSFDHENA